MAVKLKHLGRKGNYSFRRSYKSPRFANAAVWRRYLVRGIYHT